MVRFRLLRYRPSARITAAVIVYPAGSLRRIKHAELHAGVPPMKS